VDVRSSIRHDAALAALLTAAGLLEVLAGPGGDGSRAVSAVAVAGTTLPLAWRRAIPLLPLAAIAVALIAQALLGGFLVGEAVVPLVAIIVALFSAGRHLASRTGLAAAAIGVVVLTATRVVADPAVDTVGHAVLTLVAVSLPLLVGRWARGQALLQRQLVRKAERLARDRERDARDAAEEERVRIAGDLQRRSRAGCTRSSTRRTSCRTGCGPASMPRRGRCWRASPRLRATRSAMSGACWASCAATARRVGSRRRSRTRSRAWTTRPAAPPTSRNRPATPPKTHNARPASRPPARAGARSGRSANSPARRSTG